MLVFSYKVKIYCFFKVVFYDSTRGEGNKLECIGHAYNVGKRHPERIIYYCDRRIKYKCPGSVVYYQNKNSIEIVREHNHPVDQSKIEAEKIKVSITLFLFLRCNAFLEKFVCRS
jgi:hypothetical protein